MAVQRIPLGAAFYGPLGTYSGVGGSAVYLTVNTVSIAENFTGVTTSQFTANNLDSLTVTAWELVGSPDFSISATGLLSVVNAQDAEVAAPAITVRATLSDFREILFTVTLDITNVNEAIGPVTDTEAAADEVVENAAIGTQVGIVAFALEDATDTVTYSLTSNPGGLFAIDPVTGIVTVAAAIDYETTTSVTIEVTGTSSDTSTSAQSFVITILDQNEFTITQVLDADAAANDLLVTAENGDTVGVTALATDADPLDTITYTLTDDAGGLFAIDPVTGIVTVADAALIGAVDTVHSMTMVATSSDNSSTSLTVDITVRQGIILSVFNSDLSADSHTVTYAPSGETYVYANNGGTDEILKKLPAGVIPREGYRVVDNRWGVITRKLPNGTATYTEPEPGVFLVDSLVPGSTTNRLLWEQTSFGSWVGKRLVASVTVQATHADDVGKVVRVLVSRAGGTSVSTTTNVTLSLDPQQVLAFDHLGTDQTNIYGYIYGYSGNEPTHSVRLSGLTIEDKTGLADANPSEYISPDEVHPSSGVAGIAYYATENNAAVGGSDSIVYRAGSGTPIPESQLRGVVHEAAGGNAFGVKALINDSWSKTNVLPLYESTEKAPDGTLMQVMEANLVGLTRIYANHSSPAGQIGLNTLSFVVKYDNHSELRFYENASTAFNATLGKFDLLTKAFIAVHPQVSDYGYEDLPFGCVRVWFTVNYLAANIGTTQIVLQNAVVGSKLHVWQAQFEKTPVPTSMTNLNSRAATSPSTVVESVISPDEGAMQVTLNMKVDRVDFTPASSLLFINKGTGARLLYFNPTAGAGTFLSYNGTTVTSASLDFNKGDKVIYELHYSKSANEFYIKVDNVTQSTSIESTHQPFSGFVFSGDLTVGDYGAVFPTLANIENLIFTDQPGGDFFF